MKPLFAYWKMPCLPLVAVDNCSMILKIITTQQLFHYNDRFRCFQTGDADSIWQLLSHLLVTSFFFSSSSIWHLNQSHYNQILLNSILYHETLFWLRNNPWDLLLLYELLCSVSKCTFLLSKDCYYQGCTLKFSCIWFSIITDCKNVVHMTILLWKKNALISMFTLIKTKFIFWNVKLYVKWFFFPP